jgi:hypothetical protein
MTAADRSVAALRTPDKAVAEAAEAVRGWSADDFRDFGYFMAGYAPQTIAVFAARRAEHRWATGRHADRRRGGEPL